jgi:hypothetical protein
MSACGQTGVRRLSAALCRPHCAGRPGGAAAPHSGHLNRDTSAMGFRPRPAPIGHYPTSVYSEADGGYDRIQRGADRARRRALRAALPEVDVQEDQRPF